MRIFNATVFSLCAATTALVPACAPGYVGVTATTAVEPRLVWVEPGVWIVEDSPIGVYYADGYYWRQVSGVWYRSSWYDDGFVRVGVGIVPRVVVRSYNPRRHVRYRASATTRARPIIRDHRSPRQRSTRREAPRRRR